MEEKFLIKMNQEEMLRYYENKIVEDGIKNCSEFNAIVNLTDYNTNEIKLEKYKSDILQLLYRDERVADVVIDDEFNVDMVFCTDYCPFYYDDDKNVIYNQIMDSPTYQGIELAEFVGYMGKRVIEEAYIDTRNLINNYVQTKNLKDADKEILANFLKKSIIETGFAEKYIDNINVFVTYKNFQELEKDCSVNSASDAYYLSAIAWFCLTFIFPPAVIGAVVCVYRAKKVQKGGRK